MQLLIYDKQRRRLFLAIEKGVSIGPGATAVTEIPLEPNSFDAALVKCSTGAFAPA